MSEGSDSKLYRFPVLEDRDGPLGCRPSTSSGSLSCGASGCSSMAQLHWVGGFSQSRPELGLPSEGSDSSSQGPPVSLHSIRKNARSRLRPDEDVEMKSSGSSGSGSESHGNESNGNESHGNESHSHESVGSSNGNSKDSALLESSESIKSSNSHSPSPPSSSNAYSLLSSEQDNPSTSGCSSEESAKAKNQKEVIKTLKELKLHVPADKKHTSKSTTLNALKYALRCVKQVEANEEYYQLLMINDSQPSGLDVSSYTIEEIDSITSEYTLKNNDIFAVAVSLISGRIVYISDQAASILNCKRDVFQDSKFVEFLTPQDVSVFYSFTTPYRLPSWSMCAGAECSPSDCMQEKSFFCRIGGGKECEGELRYYPFRMTPYLMKVQDSVHAEDQFCCLLLAEKVHSGYDAPRIPTDKRVFTTTHTPGCVFQDVDERAVPLLGYLPQDLIGTPVLLRLHPSDRQIMLAIHRKILQCAGQPFDHSSIRFCAQNGEYVILDTSWSSFVNPWSRKVSFVIGRHKVRMGPMNEDIFMPPVSSVGRMKTMDPDIQEISEQIHRLLLQPVHNSGSSGYSSLNSNDHLQGMTSSSESLNNGNGSSMHQEGESKGKSRPRTFHEICKGIHLQKCQEQQSHRSEHKKSSGIESAQNSQAAVRPKDSSHVSNWKEASVEESRATSQEELSLNDQTVYSYQQISCLDSVIRYLDSYNVPLIMKRKCLSSSNTTSSNSDEDKQKTSHGVPASEEITEDVPGAVEAEETSHNLHYTIPAPSPEREPYKELGLTKEVLAAHTQKEEQAFLYRVRELRGLAAFQANCSQSLEHQRVETDADASPAAPPCKQEVSNAGPTTRRGSRNKKINSKRAKLFASSDNTAPHQRRQPPQPPQSNCGFKQTSWSPSDAQSTLPMAYTVVMPGYPLQVHPGDTSTSAYTDATAQGFGNYQAPPCPPTFHSDAFTSQVVTPVVALMLPNYIYPLMDPGHPPPSVPVYQVETGGIPSQMQPFGQAAFPGQGAFPSPPQNHFTPLASHLCPSFYVPLSSETPKPPVESCLRSSTPQSGDSRGPMSPPLFHSCCSSPLNLLELELSVDRQDNMALSSGGQGSNMVEMEKGASANQAKERELKQRSSRDETNISDAISTSSDMLDIILQEDSYSGTGSATSGSMGSGSNGCGTSASGISKSRTSASGTSGSFSGSSNNSSKYFGSVDSSQSSQKVKGHSWGSEGGPAEKEQSEQFIKCVLQDPLWLLMANTEEEVMMTYELPSRDIQSVLREDSEKMRLLQQCQPRFSEEQKKELSEVHPWIKKGGLPKAIDVKGCSSCDITSESAAGPEDHPDMDLGDTEIGDVVCLCPSPNTRIQTEETRQ
uniref:Period circadian protein homolog 2 n=1 Tax=Nothobranchius korthausae TaxID=1143690 RepID=A0A1A8F9F7_9TELE